MNDDFLSSALFTLIVAGAAALASQSIDAQMLGISRSAVHAQVTEIVKLPMVTVIGHRDAGDADPSALAAAAVVAPKPVKAS